MTDETLEERVKTLEKQTQQYNARLLKLENHAYHPPHVEKLLKEIKERKVVTVKELKEHFPKLYGGMLTRLYEAVLEDRKYHIIRGRARWSPTILAYFGDEVKIPNDPVLRAIDYFQRIPIMVVTSTIDGMGRRKRTEKGKSGSIKGIMKAYDISQNEAYNVWRELLYLFKQRIKVDPVGKRFRRKY